MELQGSLGGGVLLVLAAGLWMLYLVPNWLRRREYDATERNAVRLQQTLRVLAETAELPAPVRVEATARAAAATARTLAEQERAAVAREKTLAAAQRARDAAARRNATRELAAAAPAITAVATARITAAQRLRRTRAFTSLLLFAAVATIAVQLVLMATTGVAAGALAVLGFSGVVAFTSFSMLGRLAAISRRRATMVAERQPAVRRVVRSEPRVAEERAWTPVAVPKPVYLSRTVMEQLVVDTDVAAAELEQASREAEEQLRAAQAALPTLRAPRPAIDLDEVLARRRAAG
jgi:hypothetical protein